MIDDRGAREFRVGQSFGFASYDLSHPDAREAVARLTTKGALTS